MTWVLRLQYWLLKWNLLCRNLSRYRTYWVKEEEGWGYFDIICIISKIPEPIFANFTHFRFFVEILSCKITTNEHFRKRFVPLTTKNAIKIFLKWFQYTLNNLNFNYCDHFRPNNSLLPKLIPQTFYFYLIHENPTREILFAPAKLCADDPFWAFLAGPLRYSLQGLVDWED